MKVILCRLFAIKRTLYVKKASDRKIIPEGDRAFPAQLKVSVL
jgi:hypothetical protein